jgi:HEAT repeat protein
MTVFCHGLFCTENGITPHQIVYTMQAGHVNHAIELYHTYQKEIGHHDLELLQRLGLILIDQGWRSQDPEVQVLTIFGAGISTNEKTLYILEGGLRSPIPQIQLVALNLLAKFQNDEADDILNKALGANHLLIRIEALSHLAEKKHPKAEGQIEALMSKVDEQILPLFPKLFAMVGDASSIKNLKKLLNHAIQNVRIAAILSAAKFERDDLLPQIRMLASHHEIPQQEACAIALGMMHDDTSIPRLEKMVQSPSVNVRLAALQALYRLGRQEVKSQIEEMALNSNLFAVASLGEIYGSEAVLHRLLNDKQIQVKINACLALLKRQDPACLPLLKEIFVHDPRDLCFDKITSIGGGLSAWKVVPSGRQNFQDDNVAFEVSLNMREAALEQALDLSEKDFLQIANVLFEHQQNELIPTLAHLLENLQTPEAIALLKKHQQKAGAPLIRNYCNLALFSMGEEGPYGDQLKEWVLKQQKMELIRFRPCLPWESRDKNKYELTPEETSRLLVDTFEAFARSQNDKGVDVLLEAIANGNEKNKYALAGLLIRATM